MIPISRWELVILTHSSLVTEMAPEVSSFLRSRASAFFVGLGLRLMLNPEATIVAWGSLPGRTTILRTDIWRDCQEPLNSFTPFVPSFPPASGALETVLTDSVLVVQVSFRSCLENRKEIPLFCSVSLIQSLGSWVFDSLRNGPQTVG